LTRAGLRKRQKAKDPESRFQKADSHPEAIGAQ
jgi:hypothetical protein